MNLVVAVYSAILFFVLSPGVLLRLPKNGSKFVVAGVHSLVFAVILYFTAHFVWRMSLRMEGFKEGGRSRGSGSRNRGSTTAGVNNNALSSSERTRISVSGAATTTNAAAR